MLIAVNRGRGQQAVLPPCPFSPLPMFCPWRRVIGHLSCLLALSGAFLSLWRDKRGGHQESGKGTRGQDVLRTALYSPQIWYQTLPETQGHLGPLTVPVPGPLQCPTWRKWAEGVGTMYGADPTSSHGRRGAGPTARLPFKRPKTPCLFTAPPHLSPPRHGTELGGQECHEEEGDAHGQGQVFPLGAGPADALLKLGHLGVLSLKVFCG